MSASCRLIASSWIIEIESSFWLVKTRFESEFLIRVFKLNQDVRFKYLSWVRELKSSIDSEFSIRLVKTWRLIDRYSIIALYHNFLSCFSIIASLHDSLSWLFFMTLLHDFSSWLFFMTFYQTVFIVSRHDFLS